MHKPPPRPDDEEERLATLRKYRILDTDPESQFERIVEVAKRQLDMPLAFVAFMDRDRNFLKGRGDMPVSESPRDVSFCGHTILQDDVLVVPDALEDERFAESPIVVGDPKLRFYAGAPLALPNGQRIGTVCVFDFKPREFDESAKEKLKDLSAIVTDHLEMRLAVGNVHDEIETRRKAEEEARRQAFVDPLTELPNRNALNAFMAGPVGHAKAHSRRAMYADLDAFKQANDSLGHLAADEILRRTAAVFLEVLGPSAFVARVSGDEFVAFFVEESTEAVEDKANQILGSLAEPVLLHEHLFAPGISIGIASAEQIDDHPEELLRKADLALSAAKHLGGRCFVWHDSAMGQRAERRQKLVTDLRRAVADEAIDVHYQTIHDAADGRVIGVEALARWKHPQFGQINPLEFIGLAEESGEIVALGDVVMKRVLHDAADWDDLFIAVNLSPVQFRIDNLAGRLLAAIEGAEFEPSRVQFEVTESLLLQDTGLAQKQIAALQESGASVALDDFGTGYSSLSYLTSIPFNKLKIDRTFVNGIEENRINATIVHHIVSLAGQLDMRVTAEGVETEQQEVLLRAAGCNSFQGYRFGRPTSAASITRLLRSDMHRRAS